MKLKEVKKILALALVVSSFSTIPTYAAEKIYIRNVDHNSDIKNESIVKDLENPLAKDQIQVPEMPIIPQPENQQPETPVPDVQNPMIPEHQEPSEKPIVPDVKPPEQPPVIPQNPQVQKPIAPTPQVPTQKPVVPTPQVPTQKPAVQKPQVAPVQKPVVQKPNRKFVKPVIKPILKNEYIEDSLRFKTIRKEYAFSKDKVFIKEEKREKSRNIGQLEAKGFCYIIKDEKEWLFIESGNTRGFVKKSDFYTSDHAKYVMSLYRKLKKSNESIETIVPLATTYVLPFENKAYRYSMNTTENVKIEKKFALAKENDVKIYEDINTKSKVIGSMNKNYLCYIIKEIDEQWSYVESGVSRGFVKNSQINQKESVQKDVFNKKEYQYKTAKTVTKPIDNRAFYYSKAYVDIQKMDIRQQILEYAAQFIGNPYVWGGNDPNTGADCSGFVRYVYREFGIHLPRVSADQAFVGKKIPLSEALPGDLIFYKKPSTGRIYHVAIHSGNGKTIEAKSKSYGITRWHIHENACWATRVIPD